MALAKYEKRVVQLWEKDRTVVNYFYNGKWYSVCSEKVGDRGLWRTEVNGILVAKDGYDCMSHKEGVIEAKKMFLTKISNGA